MALTPDTDQFSQFLRLAFLRSPNFLTGVSGWTINQDGSVEFNNGTFRGVIEGGRLLIYNGTPAAGNLIGSISGTTTPDRFGNAVNQGITSYSLVINAIVQMLGGTFNFGSAAQIGLTGGKQPGSVGLEAATEGTAQLSTGLNGSTDVAALLLLWSKNAGGTGQPFLQFQTIAELFTPASLPAQQGDAILYDSANAFPNMRPGTVIGDTTAYQLGQATFRNTTDQTNVTNAQATITGLSATLGAGLYRISGVVTVTNTSVGNATPTLGISGPALANVRVSIEAYSITNNTFKGAGQITAQGTRFGMTSALAAGESGYFKFDGILNVSAAGAFNMTGGTTAAGTTMTYSAYSYVTYWPVN